MTTYRRLMLTRIEGQHSITLSLQKDSYDLPFYCVEYGAEQNDYDNMEQALNRFNQCCLHAETAAGFHSGDMY